MALKGSGRVFSEEEIRDIERRLIAKESRRIIANHLGIGIGLLSRVLKRHGIEVKAVRAKEIEDKLDTVIERYRQEGIGYQQLAREMRLDPSHLRAALVRRGLKIHHKTDAVTEQAIIADYRHSGLLNQDILKKHGVSETVLERLIHENKLERVVKPVRPSPWERAGKRTPYQCWLDKYGREEADRRMALAQDKMSRNSPRFGKPALYGGGKSWQGWYKGVFFRSLKELTYMTKLERGGVQWMSGEGREWMVSYIDWDGKTKTYRADFILPATKEMVEVKPKTLWDTPKVKRKKEAAEAWCKERGLTYMLVDPGMVDGDALVAAYQAGHIKWIERTQKRFEEVHGEALTKAA